MTTTLQIDGRWGKGVQERAPGRAYGKSSSNRSGDAWHGTQPAFCKPTRFTGRTGWPPLTLSLAPLPEEPSNAPRAANRDLYVLEPHCLRRTGIHLLSTCWFPSQHRL